MSLFKNAYGLKPVKNVPLSHVLDGIGSGRWAGGIKEARAVLKRNGEEAFNDAKKTLLAFTISGVTLNRTKGETEFGAHSNLLQIDLDHLEDLDAIRERVKADPHVAFGFVSPSGAGLKLGLAIDGERHLESFLTAENYFRANYNLEIDPAVKDRGRLCFISHDPDLWRNEKAVPLTLSKTVTVCRVPRVSQSTKDPKVHKRDLKREYKEHEYGTGFVVVRVDSIKQAALIATPTRAHKNHFLFARLAGALRAYEHTTGNTLDTGDLSGAFEQWFKAGKPFLRKRQSKYDYFLEFMDAWRNVTEPLHASLIDQAWRASDSAGTPPEALAKGVKPGHGIVRLIAFCSEFQKLHGDEPFELASTLAARLLGQPNHTTAAMWLSALCSYGILVQIEKGDFASGRGGLYRYVFVAKGIGRANRYQWTGIDSPVECEAS